MKKRSKIGLNAVCFLVAQAAFADTLTWTGASDSLWSNPMNWMSDGSHTIPQSGDSLVFPLPIVPMNNDILGLTIPSITLSLTTGTVTMLGESVTFNNSTITYPTSASAVGSVGFPSVLIGTTTLNVTTTGTTSNFFSGSTAVSGTGGIHKTGSGLLNMIGNGFTYSGFTQISGGEVRTGKNLSNSPLIIDSGARFNIAAGTITVGGLSGSGTVDSTVVSNGTFVVSQGTGDSTFSGGISPVQPLDFTKTGPFTLTLSSTSTYIGATRVSGGTLEVSGPGSLTGTTSVLIDPGATLLVDGTINPSATNINVQGTLRGTGHVGPVTVNSGTVSLGSTDILHIAGNYTQTTGTYNANITAAGQSSLIDLTGTANIAGGTINIIPDSGPFTESTSYTLLSSTSLTGNYTLALTAGSSGLTLSELSLSYPNNTVLLTITPPPTNPTTISTDGLTGNNLALANYLNSSSVANYLLSLPAGTSGNAYSLLLELPEEELPAALVAISPSRTTSALFISQNTVFNLSKLISLRTISKNLYDLEKAQGNDLAFYSDPNPSFIAANDIASFWPSLKKKPLPVEEEIEVEEQPPPPLPSLYSVWMTGFGYFVEQQAQDENPKFDSTTGGLVLGVERHFLDLQRSYLNRCVLGGALSYNKTSLNQHQLLGSGEIEAGFGSLYGTANFHNGIYVDVSFWGNYQRIENTRNVFYTDYSAVSKSAHNSYGGDIHGALGFDSHFSKGNAAAIFEPYVAVDWAFQSEEAYAEQGSNVFNMNIEGRFSSMLRLDVGLNNYFSWFYDWGMFTCRGTFSYVNKFPFNTGSLTASIVGAPGSFSVTSFTDMQAMFVPGVELAWRTKNGGLLSILYDGEFGSGYTANEIAVKVGKSF